MTDTIDIESILNEIRAQIREKGFEPDAAPFARPHVSGAPDAQWLEALAAHKRLEFYRPIVTRRGPLGKLIQLFKRLIRKCITFIALPILDDQNTFNIGVCEAFEQLLYESERMSERISKLEEENAKLRGGPGTDKAGEAG